MPRILSSKIQSFTHKLDPSAFDIFDQEGMNLNVSEINEDSFTLEISDVLEPSLNDDDFAKKSHAVFNLYLVALNVCTLGLFLVHENKHLSPEYKYTDTDKNIVSGGTIVQDIFDTDLMGQTINSAQVMDSLWLYGALAKEKNEELVSEYLKGLIHLSLNYPGAHFEKDAFANFYRTFEHLVTDRLLGKKKLSNEFKEISSALSSLGLSAELIEEFRKLYIIRGSQAMHSQLAPDRISRDDTMKMKVFTDGVICRVYKPTWEAYLKK